METTRTPKSPSPQPSPGVPGEGTGAPSPWLVTLRSNFWVPLVLLALWPIGYYVERPEGLDPYLTNIVMRIGIAIVLAVSLQLINGISGQFSLGHAGFMAVGAYFAGFATTTHGATEDADGNPLAFTRPGTVLLFFVACAVVAIVATAVLAGVLAIVRVSRRAHRAVPGILFVLIVVWIVTDVARARDVADLGWSTFWPRAFTELGRLFHWLMSAGQRPAEWLTSVLPPVSHKPLTFLIALVGAGLCAAAAGWVVGLPTLRLRGDYLAIATLGFAEIIRVTFNNLKPFGQARGMSVATYANPADDPEVGILAHYIMPWIYGAAFVTTLVIWRLTHSAKGRAIRAVREDEIAAASIGLDTTHHKVMAFVFGAFFAGVAGGLYAHFIGYINPSTFDFMRSVEIVVMVTLGGLGNIWGAVIAAIILTWLPEFLRSPADWIALAMRPFGVEDASALHLPEWLTESFKWIEKRRMVIYALLLILAMLLKSRRWWAKRPLAPRSSLPLPNRKPQL